MRELTCRDVIEFLDDYLAGAQPESVRREFDAHMGECPACVDYLATYRETIRLCRAACCDDLPPPAPDAERRLVEAILAARHRG